MRAGLIEPTGIIVDAACGVSGAGRPPKPTTTFCTVDEDFTAYGLLTHRHTPEIEQAVGEAAGLAGGVQVLFTPHLAPMNRGILATCYGRANGVASTADVLDCLHDAYDDEPFVVVTDGSPSTKATLGTNVAHLTARFDARTGYGGGHRRHRQPGQGHRRPGHPVRQPAGRAARGHRPARRRGLPVTATGPSRGVDVLAHAHERAGVLIEALPYIRRFFGATIVVKYGGNAMVDPDLADRFAEDIVLLQAVGIRPVVVHGGGPQIGELMARLGKEPEFRDGLRVTDAETLDIARMVLVGKVNRDIVSAINVHAPIAVGLSGEDAGLITATERDRDLGFVGDVAAVNPAIVERLLAENLIPVVSTIGADLAGQAYNINADTVAGALAAALGAEKVIYLTDVPGLLRRRRRPRQPHHPHLGARAPGPDRRRRAHRRDDPEDRGLPRRPRRRRRLGPPARRPGAPRPAARAVHRCRASAP